MSHAAGRKRPLNGEPPNSALRLFGSVAQRVSGNLLDNLDVARLSAPSSKAMQEACLAREAALEEMGTICRLFARCVAKMVGRTKTQRKFRACIIGTGPVGTRVANMMLESGDVQPKELIIYARHFRARGLPDEVYHATSLEDAIVECVPRVIFIACTLGQFDSLAADLRPMLKPTHVVCSLVIGVSAAKVGKMLGVAHPVRAVSTRVYAPSAHLACAKAAQSDRDAEDEGKSMGKFEDAFDAGSLGSPHIPRGRNEFAEALEALREACILQATSLGLTHEKAVQACEAVISGPGMAQSTRALLFLQEPRPRPKLLPAASAYF